MKVEITGIHFVASDRLTAYVNKKFDGLEKYINRKERDIAIAEVRLREAKSKDKKEYQCEVVVKLGGTVLEAKDASVNMFAAVDIVESKMKTQLKKHNETRNNPKLYRRLASRFRKRGGEL